MLVFRIKESDPLIHNWHGFKMSRDPFRFNVFLASINLQKVANYASWRGERKPFFSIYMQNWTRQILNCY